MLNSTRRLCHSRSTLKRFKALLVNEKWKNFQQKPSRLKNPVEVERTHFICLGVRWKFCVTIGQSAELTKMWKSPIHEACPQQRLHVDQINELPNIWRSSQSFRTDPCPLRTSSRLWMLQQVLTSLVLVISKFSIPCEVYWTYSLPDMSMHTLFFKIHTPPCIFSI